MKKTLLIVLLIALIVLPLTAAPALDLGKASKGQFGVGLNLGTTLGAAVKLDNKDWDLYANIGFGVIGKSFTAEIGAELPITEFKIGKAPIAVNVGAMVPVAFASGAFAVGFLGTGSLSYDFEEIPLNMYLRLGLGVDLSIINKEVKVGLGYSGALGAVWMF